jgi:hypothetical protein
MNDHCQSLADFFDAFLILLIWLCVCESVACVSCDCQMVG